MAGKAIEEIAILLGMDAKGLKQGTKEAGQAMTDLGGKIKNLVMQGLAIAGIGTGIAALVSIVKSSVSVFLDQQKALQGVKNVAQTIGWDFAEVKKQMEAFTQSGLVSIPEMATAFKNLAQTGFTLEQTSKMLEAIANNAVYGKQAGLSFGQAIVSTTEGIRMGMSTLSDAGGTTKNLGQMLTDAGISANKLANASSDVSVRMALYKGFIGEAAIATGDFAHMAESAEGKIGSFHTTMNNFKAFLGERFTPAVISGIEQLTPALETLSLLLGKIFPKPETELQQTINTLQRLDKEIEKTQKAIIQRSETRRLLGFLAFIVPEESEKKILTRLEGQRDLMRQQIRRLQAEELEGVEIQNEKLLNKQRAYQDRQKELRQVDDKETADKQKVLIKARHDQAIESAQLIADKKTDLIDDEYAREYIKIQDKYKFEIAKIEELKKAGRATEKDIDARKKAQALEEEKLEKDMDKQILDAWFEDWEEKQKEKQKNQKKAREEELKWSEYQIAKEFSDSTKATQQDLSLKQAAWESFFNFLENRFGKVGQIASQLWGAISGVREKTPGMGIIDAIASFFTGKWTAILPTAITAATAAFDNLFGSGHKLKTSMEQVTVTADGLRITYKELVEQQEKATKAVQEMTGAEIERQRVTLTAAGVNILSILQGYKLPGYKPNEQPATIMEWLTEAQKTMTPEEINRILEISGISQILTNLGLGRTTAGLAAMTTQQQNLQIPTIGKGGVTTYEEEMKNAAWLARNGLISPSEYVGMLSAIGKKYGFVAGQAGVLLTKTGIGTLEQGRGWLESYTAAISAASGKPTSEILAGKAGTTAITTSFVSTLTELTGKNMLAALNGIHGTLNFGIRDVLGKSYDELLKQTFYLAKIASGTDMGTSPVKGLSGEDFYTKLKTSLNAMGLRGT